MDLVIHNNTSHPIAASSRRKLDTKNAEGSPEFDVRTVTLKPGANALGREDAEVVKEQREKNPGFRARFERTVEGRHGNPGRTELEEAGAGSRVHLERYIRECSDPDTLRKFREAVGTDKGLASLVEDRLAATTVTTDGKPVAYDVRRDPADPRKGAR